MVLLVRGVLFGTFAVEGVGAALYAIQFIPEYGVAKGIWYSIFHAVSAFCNAGIDILGDSSLTAYVTNPIVNLTTMILIILSGLGFTVWFDIIANGKKLIRREMPRRWWFTRLKLQSKLAIIMTILLIISGAVFVFLAEYDNPETLGNLSLGNKVMASFFQSVTNRTTRKNTHRIPSDIFLFLSYHLNQDLIFSLLL